MSDRVIDIDRFGNLITNIETTDLPTGIESFRVELGSFHIDGIADCYADAERGEPLALFGSADRLEIAIRDGSAADEFQADCGHPVVLRWKAAQE